MTTPTDTQTVPEAPLFDPFPEPNTMPAKWDVAALSADPEPASASSSYPSTPYQS